MSSERSRNRALENRHRQRQQDERDLAILREYEAGADPTYLTKRYRSTKQYVNKLIKEALTDG